MAKFRNPRRIYWLGGLLLAISISVFVVFKSLAQNQTTDDLLVRLQQRDLPVVSVTTISRIPYTVKIVLQSASQTHQLTGDDNWSMLLARREAGFAYRLGSRLASYQLEVINQPGEIISSSESFLYPCDQNQQLSQGQSEKTNAEVRDFIQKDLTFTGLEVKVLDVFSEAAVRNTGLVLVIELMTSDILSANQALPGFLNDYFGLLATINQEAGANIVLTRLRVKDQTGHILLDYVKDLKGGTSHWTIAEGVYDDWFPKPVLAPKAPDATLRIETNFLYPPPPTSTAVPYP